MSHNWLIHSTATQFSAMQLEAIVWMYHSVTQHRTNGIPTAKTYKLVFHDKFGESVEVSTRKKQVEGLLDSIYQRAPWIITGYSDQLAATWRDSAGRQQMINEVGNRQNQN